MCHLNESKKFPSQRSATFLLNFVRRHDEVARLVENGRCVQVVCSELDLSSEFIKLVVERHKSDLVLHDGGYTLNGLKMLHLADQDELNRLLDVYNIEPLIGRSRCLQIVTSRENYPNAKQDLCEAIQMVERFFETRNVRYA